MEKVSERIKKSSLGLVNISKSISLTNQTLSTTRNSVDNISKVIANNTKIKNELFQRSSIIESRRKEASRRREKEDQLEASRVSTVKTKGLSYASKTSGGVFSRLLSFLGYVTAGWLIENLPTWIFVGKEFISRIEIIGKSIFNMTGDIQGVLSTFGDILGSSLNAILNLNFDEFSEESFRKSFDELNLSMGSIGQEIMNIFERAPGLGEISERSLYDESGAGGGANQTRASVGTREQRAMLDTIAWAEGGVTYRTMFGGGQFDTSKGWKHPDTVVNASRYSSTAAGRYQFLSTTWNRVSSALGLQDFSPINQDKGAIWLMDYRLGGNSADILKREGVSDRVLNALSGEWAAIPMANGGSRYGQPVKTPKQFRDMYNSLLGTVNMQSQQTMAIPNQSALPTLPPTNTLSGQSYGAPRDDNGDGIPDRKHAGVDFDADPNGTFYSRIGGEVIYSANAGGKYGNVVDVYNQELGVTERIAEGTQNLVRVGQRINPGTPVQQGTHQTGVFHYEIRKGKAGPSGSFEGTLDPIKFLKLARSSSQTPSTSTSTASPISAQPQPSSIPAPATVSSPPQPSLAEVSAAPNIPSPAPSSIEPQISAPPNQMQQMQITPERRGQNIIVADTRQAPQVPQYISSGSGGSQYFANTSPNEFELLNNFIKNKLLLDLAYL